jgi:hypothetical protein
VDAQFGFVFAKYPPYKRARASIRFDNQFQTQFHFWSTQTIEFDVGICETRSDTFERDSKYMPL